MKSQEAICRGSGFHFPWVTCPLSCYVLCSSGYVCSTISCNHCPGQQSGFFRCDRPFGGAYSPPSTLTKSFPHPRIVLRFCTSFFFFLLTMWSYFHLLKCELRFLRSFHFFVIIIFISSSAHPILACPNKTRWFFFAVLCF